MRNCISRWVIYCFFIAVPLLSLILLLEISARLFLPEYLWKFRDTTEDWQLDYRLGWVNKPNLDVTFKTEEGDIGQFQTNADGITPKDMRRLKKQNTLRIMMFGDSVVLGRAIHQDRRINADLENILRNSGIAAEVINAGVEGYSTDQSLLRMEQLLPLYRPDIIIYAFCENDFGGNVLRTAYGLSKPMFILNDGNLIELQPQITVFKIEKFGKNSLRKWVQYSALYRFLRPKMNILLAKFSKWEAQNILGTACDFYWKPESLSNVDSEIFTALLRQMKQSAQNYDAKFFFYSHPSIEEVWGPYIENTEHRLGLKQGEYNRYALENYLSKIADNNSIAFCPIIDLFITNQASGPFHLLPRNPHCNSAGYRLTAEAIAQFLQRSDFLQ